jgi:oxidoreductase
MSSGCADEMKTAVIFGATGAVGKPLLSHLLSSPQYSKVHAIVRRPFKENSEFKEETKLQEHIIDFEELLKDGSASNPAKTVGKVKASAVYITCKCTRDTKISLGN